MAHHHTNIRLLFSLCALAVLMLGVAYSFVPLYRIFCNALGIPIPSVRVGEAGEHKNVGEKQERTVTIRFQANNAQGIPVTLAPTTHKQTVHVGEPFLTAYTATNHANREIHGVAVHTILALGGPAGVDINDYVQLEQCFCFEEQTYPAGQTINLPLQFTLTQNLPQGIHTITFGYTLFEKEPE